MSSKSLLHSRVKNRLMGIPFIAGNHLLLYYNKRLVSEPALNWQQLSAQKNTIPTGADLIAWSYNEMYWFIPFLGAFEALPYENGNVNLNAQGTATALDFYRGLATSGIVAPECHYQCSFDKFVAGEVAYMINGSWALNGFTKALGNDLGIAQLPQIQGKVMKPYSSVFALAFPGNSASSEKQDALKQLAMFLQSDQIQRRIWDEYQFLPANSSIQKQIQLQSNDNISQFIMQLDNASPLPTDPEMSIIWEALVMGFNRHQGGALNASQASEYMQYVAEKTRRELY
ncbi:sugar ABC transporter substrate-binding protein [Planctobacterium marinum]|uniref:sugar ABC transporter substrate-binding protein n=1 Tax=Planctobacterium marinum TaxID=1631968 RepID=UPI002B4BD35D|nr:extracellular solute-binding protein [Planctobacterium marinum]